MDEPRVITESLGGSPLARLAVEGRAPASWYEPRPLNPNEWRQRAADVASQTDSAWAKRLAPAFVQHEVAAKRLARVVAANGIVVTTGQQPGLFGGPIYTTSKALSALALADAIEGATGIATAPVFWAATDDADYLEAASTVVVIDGAAHRLSISADRGTDGVPLHDVALPDVDVLIARLEAASGSSADPRPIALVRRAYCPGSTVGGAYVQWCCELLGPLGISVLDAGHEAVRQAGDAVMRRALDRAAAVERAVSTRDAELTQAGYTPQVESLAGRSLVFQMGENKLRLTIGRAAAAARDIQAGELSPNVLLRPVVERSILPTVAYVAGPAELAYFAQSSAVAEALDAPVPLAVPRWSATIVEPHVQRTVNEFNLTLAEFAAQHTVEAKLARDAVPDAVTAQLLALRGAIDAQTQQLREKVVDSASLPLRLEVIEGARRTLQFKVDRLERRVLAAAKHSDGERRRKVAAAIASLYPFGKRQERAANIVPFLARYGARLLQAMQAEAATHAQRLVAGQPIT